MAEYKRKFVRHLFTKRVLKQELYLIHVAKLNVIICVQTLSAPVHHERNEKYEIHTFISVYALWDVSNLTRMNGKDVHFELPVTSVHSFTIMRITVRLMVSSRFDSVASGANETINLQMARFHFLYGNITFVI